MPFFTIVVKSRLVMPKINKKKRSEKFTRHHFLNTLIVTSG